jgi:hypothetical protein
LGEDSSVVPRGILADDILSFPLFTPSLLLVAEIVAQGIETCHDLYNIDVDV